MVITLLTIFSPPLSSSGSGQGPKGRGREGGGGYCWWVSFFLTSSWLAGILLVLFFFLGNYHRAFLQIASWEVSTLINLKKILMKNIMFISDKNKKQTGRWMNKSQGWDFAHRFSKRIAKNERMSVWLKKQAICSFAHFWWETWAVCSCSLIFGEQPERIA